jgi:hypothetical protein
MNESKEELTVLLDRLQKVRAEEEKLLKQIRKIIYGRRQR